MDVVLFGIQGSGKGTQAKKLATNFGYTIFEAGGELRRIAASGTPLGEMVKEFIDQGHLVPHHIIMRVVKEAIEAHPATTKLIFDGVPRDQDQMNDFNEIMKSCGREFRCIEFIVNEEEVIERLRKRAVDQKRADDASDESIKRRMGLFHEKTEPVIAAYRAQGKVAQVQGDGEIDEVFQRLVSALAL